MTPLASDVTAIGVSEYAAGTPDLWVGASTRAVVPPLGIAHAGWSNQLHERSTGNHKDLAISVLVLGSVEGPLTAIVVLEVCVLTMPEASVLREAVAAELDLPARAVRVSATHTHACPALNEITGSWIRGGRDLAQEYWQLLLAEACGAVLEARTKLRPARVAHSSGSSTVPVYRRVSVGGQVRVGTDPLAPVSRSIDVVRIDDESGARVATIVAMGAHPTVLSGANTLVSGDYPGEARRVVSRVSGAPCLFLQGAAADVSPRRTFTNSLDDVESLGREVGYQVLSLAEAADCESDQSGVEPTAEGSWLAPATPPRPPFVAADLAVVSLDVSLAVKSNLGDQEELVSVAAEAEAELYRARSARSTDAEIRDRTIAAKRAALAVDRRRSVGDFAETHVEVHVIRIGDVALASLPVEPFWRSAQQVARNSPVPVTILSGYSNGYFQYLPRSEDHDVGGYEVEMSPFLRGAAEKLERATVEGCRRVAKPGMNQPYRSQVRVFADDLDHPEGIAVADDGYLWSGGEAGQVYRISPDGKQVETVARLASQVLGVAVDHDGSCVCCTRGGSVERVTKSGVVSLVFDSVEGRALRLPNFPAFDDLGRLFVSGSGDYGNRNGEIYCHALGDTSLFHRGPFQYPNGLAVSPDGLYLYVAQTLSDDVVRFRLDGGADPEVEAVCPPGSLRTMPDGLAFDEAGALYVTSYGRDCVYRLVPGEQPVIVARDDRAIATNRVTNCAFAPPPSTKLYLANLGGRLLSVVDVGAVGHPLRSGRSERRRSDV